MKKGLSVLLIAAAIFGFYGGSVSLNDVLACKDYWEVEGEKSTADMNKLEDGLNQLKDNEEAYLDGLDQVKDGEEELAKGEADYADGQETLAEGEASYAAAPAKLAAAEKKIAAGEAALAKGESDLDSLNTLIGGIKQVLNGYPTFKNGYKQLRDGRVGTLTDKGTQENVALITSVLGAYAQSGNQLAMKAGAEMQKAAAAGAKQNPKSFSNEQYDGFNEYLTQTVAGLTTTGELIDSVTKELGGYVSDLNAVPTAAKDAATKKAVAEAKGKDYQEKAAKAAETKDPADVAAAQKAGEEAQKAVAEAEEAGKTLQTAMGKAAAIANDSSKYGNIDLAFKVFLTAMPNAGVDYSTAKGMLDAVKAGPKGTDTDSITAYATAAGTVAAVIKGINDGAQTIKANKINGTVKKAKQWIGGYDKITSSDTKSTLKTLVGGVAQIIGGVKSSGNKELINGMNRAAKAAGFDPSDFTPAASSKLAVDMASSSWLENFYNDGNKIEKAFKSVLPALNKKASDGAKTLAAGKKTLAAGKAQYAQGLADYAAAPAKLAAGRKALAEGLEDLMEGRKALADGKAKLAEYEDGEQQVRDGLATLMSTEPNGGLESILDRRAGDDDFDNGDTHLDIDEGLDAVTVGRGYQSDSGVLITEELTARAVGTAAGLAAGVLALLAALLSFLKKNKGAGVMGILSAIAGGAGLAYGTSKGMEFSNIAGSDIGNMPLIAAGVLTGVAAVFAIVHLAAKKEA